RFDIAELEQPGDHLLGGRRLLPAVEIDGDVRAGGLLLLHELPVLDDRVDRPVVGVEGGDEDGPHVVGGDRRVGEDGDLPGDEFRQDEVALGELADELDHFGEVPLVEGHHHCARLVVDLLLVDGRARWRLGGARRPGLRRSWLTGGRRSRRDDRNGPPRWRWRRLLRGRRRLLRGWRRLLRGRRLFRGRRRLLRRRLLLLRARRWRGDEGRREREQESPAQGMHEVLPGHSMEYVLRKVSPRRSSSISMRFASRSFW